MYTSSECWKIVIGEDIELILCCLKKINKQLIISSIRFALFDT